MAFTYTRVVRFQDTDAAGVVYFANVLTMCHEAYEASLAVSGFNLKVFFSNSAIAFPIVHANVDFFRPLFCGDSLSISLTPQKLQDDSFEIAYEIAAMEKVAAKAITRHVCIDAETRKRQSLSEEMRLWLQQEGERTTET
ncbi:acyl-CoA thioesterase [Gloeocapsopsis dulcis]|uniref:1,4-dihydroxy-2-naphthoyl-CoA hydrolase n=1 Tax=Gloeocapsopsis dulcis AAB1 = 1H9 TaxID=1433147 RepID=A0A6N8FT05_9CHRO|nr:thioesterase family protein [Gloeocapsopsis dulcis]MUL36248.1 1,4-dihydroxy-2-naphthoyl-CoA hydrolase [Gloeocapsopsis dulcis AAB1 = 1H9]WNN89639.1 thioesterase family protein [Gloeocapsopsis dulcis]